jgi:septin family protein
MTKKKEKSLFEVLQEINTETSKMNGIIKQPEKKFNEWEKDFQAWDRRFSKRMTDMEKILTKQMGKMERFFE